jgi:regulator of RNase E activity RraA
VIIPNDSSRKQARTLQGNEIILYIDIPEINTIKKSIQLNPIHRTMKRNLVNKNILSRILLIIVITASAFHLKAQELYTPVGVTILKNKSFDNSDKARREILDLYKDLRVTDVLDGMDLIGLQDIGLMDNDIRPLWRDPVSESHTVVGFALTVRYVPSDTRSGVNSFRNIDEAKAWKNQQYGRAGDSRWMKAGKPGDVIVMDVNGVFECGNIGSNNSLDWAQQAFAGVITNGGARDTDEIIKTAKLPVYCRNGYSTRGIRPGRLIIESFNFPISCAGVLVYPGDVIVADGDGVIVVPREHAIQVGQLAREIMLGDQSSRAGKLDELNKKK